MHINWGMTVNSLFLIPQICHYWFVAVFKHIFHSSQGSKHLAAHMSKRDRNRPFGYYRGNVSFIGHRYILCHLILSYLTLVLASHSILCSLFRTLWT